MLEIELNVLIFAVDQIYGVNEFFGTGILEQEREALHGFVSEAAAAGFFPREVLLENVDGIAGASELFAAHGTGRTAADDCNFCHGQSQCRTSSISRRGIQRNGRSVLGPGKEPCLR